jgi:hypothetical protein
VQITKKAALALAALSILLAAACGDDEDDTATPSTAAEREASSSDGSVASEFCAAALAIEVQPDPEIDETATSEQITEVVQAHGAEVMRPLADDVVATAPEEVSSEVDALSGAVDQLAAGDPAAFEAPPVVEASERYDAFVDSECGWVVLDVTTTDYEFDGIPSELEVGPVRIRIDNGGDEVHEVLVLRVEDGTEQSIEQILELPEEEALELVTPMGAPAFALPGERGASVLDLVPGDYVAICMIPTGVTGEDSQPAPGAAPHAAQGMVTPFSVA